MNKRLFIFMLLYISILAEFVISQSLIPDYDYSCTQNFSIIQSPLAKMVKEPIPYFIPYPNATCFRFGCTTQEAPFNYNNVDINKDGIIDGTILYTKYDVEVQNYNFSFSSSSPMIKQNDVTLLEKIDFCYIHNNKTICNQDGNFIQYIRSLVSIKLENRLDIFSIVTFQTIKKVDAVCPLSIDFGNWPIRYLHPISDEKRLNWKIINTDVSIEQSECTVPTYLNFSERGIEGYVYNKTLILLGEQNTGVIITKPDNYYFQLDNIENSKKVRVCTNDQNDSFSLLNGINLFSFAGISDPQKIGGMSFLLSLPSVQVSIKEPEIVRIKNFLIGNALPFNFQSPQITPSLDFRMEEDSHTSYQNISFSYKDYNGEHSVNIPQKNGKYHFEETVILDGNPFNFPFLNYTTTIYSTYPKKISESKVPLSFDEYSSFTGYAYFSKDRIDIIIYPKLILRMLYWVSLVLSTLFFIFLMLRIKHMKLQAKPLLEILGYIILIPVFGSSLNLNLIYSKGFIPHFIYIFILLTNLSYRIYRLRLRKG